MYLNNAINSAKAKVKPPRLNKNFKQDDEDLANMKKLNQISRKKKVQQEEKKKIKKQENDDSEEMPNEFIDFDKICESQGINLDELLNEGEGDSGQLRKEPMVFNQNNIMELLAMAGLNLGKEAKVEEQEEPEVYEHDTSENENAPMSALVSDSAPEENEESRAMDEEKKKMAFKKSLVEASSASEDERGLKNNCIPPGLSSDEEMIDTASKSMQQTSILGDRIRPASNYPSNRVTSTGSGITSTFTGEGLMLQVPGLFPPTKPEDKPVRKEESKYSQMTPDSLLFKSSGEVNAVPVDQYRQRPQTASTKTQYRGVWIENDASKDESKDTEEEDRYYFNTQRELMKQRIRDTKNSEFGDIDKLKMENVGVEIVGKQKLVKVERDWGESMGQFDHVRGTKDYKEDDEAQIIP
jgi:hypothetical protein